MSRTRTIILADGKDKQWNNFLDKPRHLITLNGKTLLGRSVGLLRENGINDIYITTHNDLYETKGAKLWASESTKYNIDKIWACKDLWVKDTLLVWGDVFFTEEAMRTIVQTPAKQFRLFARFGMNKVLKNGGTEVFALRIKDRRRVKLAVNYVRKLVARGADDYPDNTLTLYARLKHYQVFDDVPEKDKDCITVINDLTTDIDQPKDFKRLIFYINNRK